MSEEKPLTGYAVAAEMLRQSEKLKAASSFAAPSGSALPWVCPKHPKGQVRHSWDDAQYALNGYPAGEPLRHNHRWECAECGTELAAPNDKLKHSGE